MAFLTDTPHGINNYTWDQVLDLIKESPAGLPTKKARLRVLSALYQIFGYELTPDAAYAILDRTQFKQIIAPAGAGKTSMQLAFIIFNQAMAERELGKKLYGSRVLSLVYTEDNVGDIALRHEALVSKVKRTGIKDLFIDVGIDVKTIHGFCNEWMKEYAIQCNKYDSTLIVDSEIDELLEDCLALASKKYEYPELENLSVFVDTYNFMHNSMLPLDHKKVRAVYEYRGITYDQMELMLRLYEKRKQTKKVYDYMDMLTSVRKLLEENEVVRKRIQSNYDLITFDEWQDTNALMKSIVNLIVGENTPFLCVADEDQTIFEFNGADPRTLLTFRETYGVERSKIYALTENRRCPQNILDLATKILKMNANRFDKEIFTKKSGGDIELISYSSLQGQMETIAKKLRGMSRQEMASTMISYRNVANSTLLVEFLEENKIPFNLLRGVDIFGYELYRHMFNILDMLAKPYDEMLQVNLFKVTPIRRTEIEERLGIVRGKIRRDRKRSSLSNIEMFYDKDYGAYSADKNFTDAMSILKYISQNIRKMPMNEYIGALWHLLNKYYWNFRRSENEKKFDSDATDELMYGRVVEFFNSDAKYPDFFNEYVRRREHFRALSRSRGVQVATLSTFHKLKGLECDHHIMTFMDDSLFPSIKSVGFEEGNEEDFQDAIEAENRLAYVAVTRAKKSLTMLYPVDNPSIYVKLAQQQLEEMKQQETTNDIPPFSLDDLSGGKKGLKFSESSFLSKFK